MFAYLDKFKKLPPTLKTRITSPAVLNIVDELEKKYNVDLAPTVMKVMVKEIPAKSLGLHLAEEFQLEQARAEALSAEMLAKVFAGLEEYLGVLGHQDIRALGNQVTGALGVAGKVEEKVQSQSIATNYKLQSTELRPAPNFFFSAEDEEEIKKISDKIVAVPAGQGMDIESKVDQIWEKSAIQFGSQALADRFRQVMRIYIKGIRDRIETRLALTRDYQNGGLGFDQESAYKVLNLADTVIKDNGSLKMKQPLKMVLPEDKIPGKPGLGARDADYDFSALTKKKVESFEDKIEEGVERLDTAHELMPPAPMLVSQAAQRLAKKPSILPSIQKTTPSLSTVVTGPLAKSSLVKKKPEKVWAQTITQPKRMDGISPTVAKSTSKIEARTQIQKRLQPIASGKKIIEDIKAVPRVLGPIDELRYMTIASFRRLGKTPVEMANKILQKLDNLEAERYSQKLAGINAWRESPVNKAYLQIGKDSISQNKAIDVIIKERMARGLETLTVEEFEAVLRLNREARY
jgi:hypothetical protein